jgi:putative oxidoreductase
MFRKLIATSSTWFTVPVRLALAAVFIAHGSQKVLGSFNGPGFKSFTAGNTPFSFMQPAWLWLAFAAFGEFFGGILIGLGFLTRVGAFLIACVMLTAIAGVHWPGGFFANNRGFEYPMALLGMALAPLVVAASSVVPQRPHFASLVASFVSSTRFFAPHFVHVTTFMTRPLFARLLAIFDKVEVAKVLRNLVTFGTCRSAHFSAVCCSQFSFSRLPA